nr:DUF1659 domain-containing protein [Bacilli bacterium]
MMVTTPLERHLQITVQVGQTASGKPKLHNITYKNVDVKAADASILAVLDALSPLLSEPISSMGRVDVVGLADSVAPSNA